MVIHRAVHLYTVKHSPRFYGNVTGICRTLAGIITLNGVSMCKLQIRYGSSHPYSALRYVSSPTLPSLAKSIKTALAMSCQFITKTYLYNFDPLQPHFYIVKLGFTGVYIIFLISARKHRLWELVRTASPRRF